LLLRALEDQLPRIPAAARRASSGAQRVSPRLPKLLSGELSVAEATGNRDLQVQPGMPKP